MDLIIETNLTLISYRDMINDFESRVIEVESWNDYINEIKRGIPANRVPAIGSLRGLTLPREIKIESLKYDDFHLICEFHTPDGTKMKKLAYLIDNP